MLELVLHVHVNRHIYLYIDVHNVLPHTMNIDPYKVLLSMDT